MSMSVNVNPNGLLVINPVPNEVSTSETNPVSNQQPDVRSDDTGPKEAPARNEAAAHREFIDSLFKKAAARGKDRITLTKKDLAVVKNKVDKTTFKAAETARKDAEKKMGALKGYTRAQLIATLKMPGYFTTTKAGQAFKDAIDAQLELANKLSDCARASSGDKTSLEHLSMQANLRAAELSRLLGELVMEAEAPNPAEDIQLEANENWLGESLARIGTDTDSNRHALDFLEKQADIRLSELPAFAAEDKTLTPDEIAAMTARLGNLSTAIETARREGIDFRGDKSGRTMVDPAVFDALDREIKAAQDRLASHTRKFVTAALVKFASELKLTEADLPNGRVANKKARTDLKAIDDCYSKLRKELKTCIEDRMAGKSQELYTQAKRTIKNLCRELTTKFKVLTPHLDTSPATQESESSQTPFRNKLNTRLQQQLSQTRAVCSEIVDVLDHWAPADTAEPQRKLYARASDLRALMKGDEVSVNDYIEARVHGYDESSIDTGISGQELLTKKELGSGAANTVYLCTFEGKHGGPNVQRVFKPEAPAWRGLNDGVRGTFGNKVKFQKALSFNMGSRKVAEMLGAGGRNVKATIGTADGRFGMFMEVAPGHAPNSVLDESSPDNPCITGKALLRTYTQAYFNYESDPDARTRYRQVAGAIMQQLNQLQWIDLITGQLDRHDGNYTVFIPSGIFGAANNEEFQEKLQQVRVTGIDNDAAFPENLTEIGVMTMSSAQEDEIRPRHNPTANPGQTLEEFFGATRTVQKNGLVSYDLTAMNEEQLKQFKKISGIRNGLIPTVIDRTMSNRITHWATEGLEDFKSQLKSCNLTDAQIDAAVARLNSAYTYIMERQGQLIIEDTDWTTVADDLLLKEDSKMNLGLPTKHKPNKIAENYFQRPKVTGMLVGT